ncbi:MAG: MarR family transcriptional regulator, partial [Candidatus Omnitrophota bacterium]
HIVILELLYEKESCMMRELAEALGLTMGAVTAIVDRMISMKLARRERSRSDRRVVRVSLLARGRTIITGMRETRRRMIDDLFSLLSAAERAEYLRLFTRVTVNLKARHEKK